MPMPGSIKTGTAPTLNNAKVIAKKSGDGGTMSAVRVPRMMPVATSPCAMASASALSSSNVIARCSDSPSGFTPRRGK